MDAITKTKTAKTAGNAVTSDIEVSYQPVPEKDIPKVLTPDKESKEEPLQQVQAAVAAGWSPEAVEALIKTLATLIQGYSKAASSKLQQRAGTLGTATAPVLNKYVKTDFGVEINCILAWSMVSLEIYNDIQKEQQVREMQKVQGRAV